MRHIIISFIVFFILGCTYDNIKPNTDENISGLYLDIPDGFDFSTHREVVIKIYDYEPNVRYDIFNYSEELQSKGIETFENQEGDIVSEDLFYNNVMDRFISSGVPYNGMLKVATTIPNYIDNVYLRRKDRYVMTGEKVVIVNNEVNYNHALNRKVNTASRTPGETLDFLYCVNGSGELFHVDPLNGDFTFLSTMPMGSWTAAIDQENKLLYSIGKSSPHPLMRYSIDSNSWDTVADLEMGGPRLDYNKNDNLLYFSRKDLLYTINPETGAVVDSWDIIGLHDLSGGDLVFAEDGALFLCTFSGLYRLDLDENNDYQSTRISADYLPFEPTSMTFDSDQNLWLANNANSSDLIIMDTVTGGWEYTWGINASNGTDFERTINDLTTLRVVNESYVDADTDNDGVLDKDDCKPNDPEISFETYTPSRYGEGTVAFEDLWPSAGDYDFNDVALNYQTIVYTNSQNLAVEMHFICTAKSHRSGFVNGIGFEINGLDPSQIESVSNQQLYEGYLSFNANGTETNQDNAVIIITDNAHRMQDDTTIIVSFTEPLNTNLLGTAPFNPFIISDKNRDIEIHLPYYDVTNLGSETYEIDGLNRDPNGDFVSNTGFPWAISLTHDFKVPLETVSITAAYNFFNDWATSGGDQNKDWYKDNPGNRNEEYIVND